MKKPSFDHVTVVLEEACEFLRSFTLGRQGFTQQDGVSGIQRVVDQCNQMEKLYPDGPDARKSMMAIASAKARISAAKARLALLRKD